VTSSSESISHSLRCDGARSDRRSLARSSLRIPSGSAAQAALATLTMAAVLRSSPEPVEMDSSSVTSSVTGCRQRVPSASASCTTMPRIGQRDGTATAVGMRRWNTTCAARRLGLKRSCEPSMRRSFVSRASYSPTSDHGALSRCRPTSLRRPVRSPSRNSTSIWIVETMRSCPMTRTRWERPLSCAR